MLFDLRERLDEILQSGDLVEPLAVAGQAFGAGLFRYMGRDMDMAARILDKLRQSPFGVEELAFDLKRNAFEVRLLVNALLREGAIVKLDTDREGGPFFALPGFVEACRSVRPFRPGLRQGLQRTI
jgi:hypothetical protein